jgi:CoA:oxalate CoA-transferase
MLDCQVAILENALARYQVSGVPPQPLGNRHPTITPFQAYKAADEYLVVAMGNDSLWRAFCIAAGREPLADDDRFATNHARTENLQALNEVLDALFVERTVEEWHTLLDAARIPHSTINSIDQVMSHPQVLARHMIVDVDDPVAGRVRIAGNPIKMSSFPDETTRPPIAELGAHTGDVLAELGYSAEECAALAAEGAI